MANNNESTMKWKVDITDLKSAMQEAKRQISQANAEFKTATAGMDKWSKSAEGLEAKIEQLNKILPEQKKQLSVLEAQYEETKQTMGENSSAAADLKIKIEEQKAAIVKTETSIDKYSNQLGDMKAKQAEADTATGKLSTKISEQEEELQDLKKAYVNATLEYGENSDEAKDLAKQIENLSGELKDNKTELNNAEKAADDLDQSLEDLDPESSASGFTVLKGALANLAAEGISRCVEAVKDFAKESIQVGAGFDSAMSQVSAVSGATGDDLAALRAKAKQMGETTQFTASEAADAFNYMAMAGWKTEDMLNGIDGVLNLAAASGADLATTSDIVTDALTAMGYSAQDAGRLADVMAAASSNANTNVEMMGETFKYAAPVAGALGFNMEDVAVAIGLMANAGIKGSQAGTALRSMMSRLAAPPKAAAESMDALGISITNADGTMKPLSAVIDEMRVKFDGLSESEQALHAKNIAGTEAMSGLLSIVNAAPADVDKLTKAVYSSSMTMDSFEEAAKESGIDLNTMKKAFGEAGVSADDFDMILAYSKGSAEDFADMLNEAVDSGYGADELFQKLGVSTEDLQKAMDNSTGSAEAMANTMLNNLGGDMTILKSQFEGVQIALYEKLEPALRSGVDALSGLLTGLSWVIDNGDTIIATVAGLATAIGTYMAITNAAAIKTGILTAATNLATAAQTAFNFVMNMNPIGLIISLIAGLVAAFVVLWNKSEAFREFWINLWETVKEFVGTAVEAVSEFFTGLWEDIKRIWETTSTWFDENVIQPVVGFFKGLWESVSGFFTNLWNDITEIWNTVSTWFDENVIQPVVGFFQNLWESVSGFFTKLWEDIENIWNTVATWFDENVVQPIKKFFEPLVKWFTELFTSIWNFIASVFTVIGQLAEGCVAIIVRVWEVVSEWFNENVVQPVAQFFTDLWEGIKNAANAAWEFIKGVWTAVSTWFNDNIIVPLSTFFTGMWEWIKTAANDAWEFIKGVWIAVSTWFDENIIQPVSQFFVNLWEGIKTAASDAWEGIKNTWTAVKDWFNDTIIKPVGDFFTGMWDGLKNGASDAWEGIKNVFKSVTGWFEEKFSAAWEAVKNVFSTGGKIFDGIKEGIENTFKTVVNAIIRGINTVIAFPFNAINGFLDTLRNLSILGISPFGWIGSISVPQIPELARGGVLKRGQIGLLEGSGAEAVVPLDENRKWIAAVVKEMIDQMNVTGLKGAVNSGLAGMTGNGSGYAEQMNQNITFNQTINSPKAVDRLTLYRETNSLLFSAKVRLANV